MCVTLIGGMDRLKQDYIAAARQGGATLKCISRNERNFVDKIGNPDAIIVFTNKVSHEPSAKLCCMPVPATSPSIWCTPAACPACVIVCRLHKY